MIQLFKVTSLCDLQKSIGKFNVEHCKSSAVFEITHGYIDDLNSASEQNIFNLDPAETFIATNGNINYTDALLISEAVYLLRSSHNPDEDESEQPHSGKRLNEATVGFDLDAQGFLKICYEF